MKEIKKMMSRNEYFDMLVNRLISPREEVEIIPLDLTRFHLKEATETLANKEFTRESKDRKGRYMLQGHWMSDFSQQFANKCGFLLKRIDGFASYGFSDDQLAIFQYTEGDIFLQPFADKADYEKEKEYIIRWYETCY